MNQTRSWTKSIVGSVVDRFGYNAFTVAKSGGSVGDVAMYFIVSLDRGRRGVDGWDVQ